MSMMAMDMNAAPPEMLTFDELMADKTGTMARTLASANSFLEQASCAELLARVGCTVESVAPARFPDKRWIQKSYGRSVSDTPEDLMAGKGLFYLTEQRQLYLDCTAGHYQMPWGYNHPGLIAVLLDGIARGIVWDNHSNIPPAPVKRLSEKLVTLANPGADITRLHQNDDALNTVLIGTATGTVACSAVLKIMLKYYQRAKPKEGSPVFVVLDGNYHGTDFLAQRLRGMWNDYFSNIDVIVVQPNDPDELESAFKQYGERIAGFWAEPIMMNREAITVDDSYLSLARLLCDKVGALMAIDEIQTCFWWPEVLYTNRYNFVPDLLVLGKGMTAGFHPLSAVLYRGRYDLLEQYDAISTNGNAALAAYLALGSIALVEKQADQIRRAGTYYHQQMSKLAEEFPQFVAATHGEAHMTGLKLREVADALGLQREALSHGLWLRVHAYHPGHSTILSKFGLLLDEQVADFTVSIIRDLLRERA